jgi:hypothetical protein
VRPAVSSSACRRVRRKLQTKVERSDPLVAPLPRVSASAHQGHHRRRFADPRRAARWRSSRSSRRASSAEPGTRCASGSSKLRPHPRQARPADDAHAHAPDTLCYLNGEYGPAARGQRSRCSTAASSSARRLRKSFRPMAAGCSASTKHMGGTLAQPRQDPHRVRPMDDATVGSARPPQAGVGGLQAQPAPRTSCSTSRSRAGTRCATMSCRRNHAVGVPMMGEPDEAAFARAAAPGRGLPVGAATSAGSAATSRAVRCSATSWRGRSRRPRERSRRSCSATAT